MRVYSVPSTGLKCGGYSRELNRQDFALKELTF